MNSTLEIDTTRFEALLHEKSGPCVSIIVPTHKITKTRMKNPDLVKKAVSIAKEALRQDPAPEDIKETVTNHLDTAAGSIDYLHVQEGIGIFASPKEMALVKFPFPVHEKVTVRNSFEIYDLLYLKQLLSPCFVLMINKKVVRLFELTVDSLDEMDTHFPHQYVEQYEYSRPSRGSSYGNSLKGFEKDKDTLNMLRLKSFLKESDAYLAGFFAEGNKKLILAGTRRITDTFESITSLKKNIIGKVYGSFDERNKEALHNQSWQAFMSYKKNEARKQILTLRELNNQHQVFKGITGVWKAAREGKGRLLLVERDYQRPTFVQKNDTQRRVSPPPEGYKMIADAVAEIIETINAKNGDILFVDKKELDSFDHIVLLSRY